MLSMCWYNRFVYVTCYLCVGSCFFFWD